MSHPAGTRAPATPLASGPPAPRPQGLGARLAQAFPWPARLWLAAGLLSALLIYGYHHPDEQGQISAFVAHKLGAQPAEDLPWEYGARMRPWLQPALYTALVRPLVALVGYHYPTVERLLLLVGVLLWLALVPLARRAFSWPQERRGLHWLGAVYLGSLWFVPSMVVRHSSEAFGTWALALALALWLLRPSSAHPRLLALGAGVAAGLSCWARFQIGFFWVGFGLVLLAADWRAARRPQAATLLLALGALATLPLGAALDWWGYGQPTCSPCNYLLYNVIEGRASAFGVEPWSFYLWQAAALALNPLLWIWLGLAVWTGWRDPLRRALAGGAALFLAAHTLVPHKEPRFLLPLLVPAGLLLLAWLAEEQVASRLPRRWAWLLHPRLLVALIAANLVTWAVFSATGLTKDRQRIERALWDLPPGTTVLGAQDYFGVFDDGLRPPPPPRGVAPWVRRFTKPPALRYVYVPDELAVAACRADPGALLLLTHEHHGPPLAAGRSALDLALPAVARFPPAWLRSDAHWYRRMWRFMLVRCADYEAAVTDAGLLH